MQCGAVSVCLLGDAAILPAVFDHATELVLPRGISVQGSGSPEAENSGRDEGAGGELTHGAAQTFGKASESVLFDIASGGIQPVGGAGGEPVDVPGALPACIPDG